MLEIEGEQSNISRHISVMEKSYLIRTPKGGVKVMVKVRDPRIFEILETVGLFLIISQGCRYDLFLIEC